ncbi:MAG: hypothetical protein J1E64_08630 [Acetatifactor sp.]|nr:hypothetical protein [Acetatifactor sp.]
MKIPMLFWKKVNKKPMEACLTLLLILQVLLIALSNLTLIDQTLDHDAAKLLKHIITMWEEKTWAIPQWSYLTTLEWDCTTLFALPLYGLTKNIYLACTLSNVIFTLILLRVIFLLFEGSDPLYPLLCANLVCIPYRVGMLDYYNMLFFSGAQYIVKILIPLLLIGILLLAEQKKPLVKNRRFWFFTLLYLVLLTVSSSSSNVYVAACGLAPVFVAYLAYKFLKWERVPSLVFVLIGLSALCTFLGMRVNETLMGGTRAEGMKFCSVYDMLNNVSSCFFGLFELVGGATAEFDAVIFSVDGMIMLAKCLLMAAFLLCGLYAIVKCVKKRGDLRLILLLSVFVWNYFILNVSYSKAGASTYDYRYHLIGVIPLMCVAAVVMVQWFRGLSNIQQKWLFLCGFAAFFMFQVLVFREVFILGEQNKSLKDLVAYVDDMNLETVYTYYSGGEAEICRLLGGDCLYLDIDAEGLTMAHDYYSRYEYAPIWTENAIVAVYMRDQGDSFELGEHLVVRFDTVGDWTLYYFAS